MFISWSVQHVNIYYALASHTLWYWC